eukprot:TRINITY_DN3611_c0_g1_i1.p1 TRINITY_DN3611_c0_g1~~TRINITY_DN3611_c0_g1_i1.p1  ORF type:complete len:266 (+),score=51.98 TRINITY_DN3611_c0_g1_i1:58-855(+)
MKEVVALVAILLCLPICLIEALQCSSYSVASSSTLASQSQAGLQDIQTRLTSLRPVVSLSLEQAVGVVRQQRDNFLAALPSCGCMATCSSDLLLTEFSLNQQMEQDTVVAATGVDQNTAGLFVRLSQLGCNMTRDICATCFQNNPTVRQFAEKYSTALSASKSLIAVSSRALNVYQNISDTVTLTYSASTRTEYGATRCYIISGVKIGGFSIGWDYPVSDLAGMSPYNYAWSFSQNWLKIIDWTTARFPEVASYMSTQTNYVLNQ